MLWSQKSTTSNRELLLIPVSNNYVLLDFLSLANRKIVNYLVRKKNKERPTELPTCAKRRNTWPIFALTGSGSLENIQSSPPVIDTNITYFGPLATASGVVSLQLRTSSPVMLVACGSFPNIESTISPPLTASTDSSVSLSC